MLRFLICLSAILCLLSIPKQTARAQYVPAVAESDRSLPESTETTTMQFSFREAQWERVLKWLAETADLTLDITDLPPGTFNYVDDREHTVAEAIDAVNGYLLPRGYVVLRRNEFLVVLKTDNPILPNLIPTVPASELDNYGNNELLRIIVPVTGFEPSEVAEQIEQFLGSQGKASPVDASEAVLLQGFGKSLKVATSVLSSATAPVTDDELVFRSIPLKNIPAADAERQIQKLFGVGNNPFAESMARRQAYYDRRRRGRDDDDDRRSGPSPLLQNLSMNMKVSSLSRTNSLLIAATPSAIKLVESILESIDVRQDGGGVEFLDDSTPVLKVYFVDEADEDDVAETINAIMPGVVLNEDGRHNAIHVYATALEHREVEKMIRTIDGGGSGGGVEVVTLYRTDPYTMGDLLTSLFENEDRDDRPVITPEFRTRSLVIRATSSQMAEIKKTLAAYGETGSFRTETAGTDTAGSRFRKVSVPSGRAEWIANAVKDLMSEDREFGNPIRVVIPGEVSREREPVDSIDNESLKTKRGPLGESDRGVRVQKSGSVRRVGPPETVFASAEHRTPQSECTVEPAPKAAENTSSDRPRVTIEVQGGELLMYSNDNRALNEIEDTIRELAQQMPARTNWTVFYLQSALAAETAEQLGQLLQDETDPYVGIGLPDTAESLALGGPSVRIIPDSRTNALFISGPESKIQEADRFLDLLDTNDLPPSLRDRVPHIIPVKHADVNEVAEMVRELFKDYMEDPNERRRDDRRGDRRDNNDDRRSRVDVQREGDRPRQVGIRLTLAVDARASELVVSCNETLYQQIQEVVDSRDQAAVDTKPQIQIVNLQEENSQSIAESLNALSSKITIGTTSQPSRRSSSSSRDSSRSSFRFNSRSRDRD